MHHDDEYLDVNVGHREFRAAIPYSRMASADSLQVLRAIPPRKITRSGITISTYNHSDPRYGQEFDITIDGQGMKIRSSTFGTTDQSLGGVADHCEDVLKKCAKAQSGEAVDILDFPPENCEFEFSGLSFYNGKIYVTVSGDVGSEISIHFNEQKTQALLEMVVEVFDEWFRVAKETLGEPIGRTVKAASASASAGSQ